MVRITIMFLALCCCSMFGMAQQGNQKTIKKSLPIPITSESTIAIQNLYGDVSVEGYNGKTIEMEATIKISTDSKVLLAKAMEEIRVEGIVKDDYALIGMKLPCDKRDWNKLSKKELQKGIFNHQNCNWETDYEYIISFKVKVPKAINVKAFTVNNGDIIISNIGGKITGNNVNGNLSLKQITGPTKTHTVNGDIDIEYLSTPPADCKQYTLNGTINMSIPKGFSADIAFKTYQGDFYTDVNDIRPLAPELTKTANEGKGISFKVEQRDKLRVRNGGILLDFETFNGKVILKEI